MVNKAKLNYNAEKLEKAMLYGYTVYRELDLLQGQTVFGEVEYLHGGLAHLSLLSFILLPG